MSMVGPRPHAVAHNELYRKLIPGYMLRHKVKPGITGLAQVKGRGFLPFHDINAYDVEYVDKRSLWLDVQILFWTAVHVVRRHGAF
jgi:putative colanic acid biosynthesis UDP-glucose lipid carrier transferase